MGMDMSAEDAERRTAKRRKRRWVRWILFAVGSFLLLVLALFVWVLIRGGRAYEERRARHHAEWRVENREAFEAFKELAGERGWKMYAMARRWDGGRSIGVYDLGRSSYRPIYRTRSGRLIRHASDFRGGRVAFVECKRTSRGRGFSCSEFDLCTLESEGVVTKVPLNDHEFDHWYADEPLALGSRSVFLISDRRAYLYDMEEKLLKTVYEPKKGRRPGNAVVLAGEKFLVLLPPSYLPDPAVVLDAHEPHAVVSRLNGVGSALAVGEHIVVQKGGDCFLYDPRYGQLEHLVSGKLAISIGEDEFLLHDDIGIYKCRISQRSAKLLSNAPVGLRHGHKKLILSPEGQFLFAARDFVWPLFKGMSYDAEYHVYELKTGEERGAFLQPCGGQFEYEFLGWVKDKRAE